MQADNKITGQIPADFSGMRLDKALALLYPDHSRSSIQKWLKNALVTVDDEILPQKQKIQGGEQIEIQLPQQQPQSWKAENISLDIIYQDTDVMVVNKPSGLVVHPGAGNPSGTLMNGLLYANPTLFDLPRAGIVHRLDKDTSGLMVIALNESARLRLVEQLQARDVTRKYLTIVNGVPISGGSVDAAISRHHTDRKRMAVNSAGKEAISHYRVVEKYKAHSLISVKLETGRTHQIRVHMQHLGFPVVGDPVYGQRLAIAKNTSETLIECLKNFKRQALHAEQLAFTHPINKKVMCFSSQLPKDMLHLSNLLQAQDELR